MSAISSEVEFAATSSEVGFAATFSEVWFAAAFSEIDSSKAGFATFLKVNFITNKSSNSFRLTDHWNPPLTQPKNPYLMIEPSTRNLIRLSIQQHNF
ncbi:1525_t:CDS:2 [Funneliformis geosporum]|nr:1525_t:CDS:2 [Funneliformis geosporum]